MLSQIGGIWISLQADKTGKGAFSGQQFQFINHQNRLLLHFHHMVSFFSTITFFSHCHRGQLQIPHLTGSKLHSLAEDQKQTMYTSAPSLTKRYYTGTHPDYMSERESCLLTSLRWTSLPEICFFSSSSNYRTNYAHSGVGCDLLCKKQMIFS